MRGTVVVDDDKAFKKWLGEQETFAMLYPKGANASTKIALQSTENLPIKTVLSSKEKEPSKTIR